MILSYGAGEGLAAILALDDTLGRILRTTREPLVGQMRLTWWHEALERLDHAPPPAEPVLVALADAVLPAGVTGAGLARTIEGWEALLDPLDAAVVTRAAKGRGEPLFAAMAAIAGANDPRVAAAGRGWAAADLMRNLSDPVAVAAARAVAGDALKAALAGRWPRALRSIGALAHAARMDLDGRAPATPRRIARLLWHRASGG